MMNHERLEYAPGEIIGGKYVIEKVLGKGGMGVVYLARHLLLEKSYALKLVRRARQHSDLLRRFQKEAKVLVMLEGHPNITSINDYGIAEDGTPFYVMDLLRGTTLHAILRRLSRVRLPYALGVGADMFDALAFAHDKGIVHRDVKPDNLFIHTVGPVWLVKLVDFGVAGFAPETREAITGHAYVGTPTYSAREQLLGAVPSPKMDVYSACHVMFLMLTGQAPFAHLGDTALARLTSEMPPAAPSLSDFGDFPGELVSLVARGLSHDPNERPDALYLAARLQSLRSDAEKNEPVDVSATVEDLPTTVGSIVGEEARRDAQQRELPYAATTPAPLETASPLASSLPASLGATRPYANDTVPAAPPSLDGAPFPEQPALADTAAPEPSWHLPERRPVDRDAPTVVPRDRLRSEPPLSASVPSVPPPTSLRPEAATPGTTTTSSRWRRGLARNQWPLLVRAAVVGIVVFVLLVLLIDRLLPPTT